LEEIKFSERKLMTQAEMVALILILTPYMGLFGAEVLVGTLFLMSLLAKGAQ